MTHRLIVDILYISQVSYWCIVRWPERQFTRLTICCVFCCADCNCFVTDVFLY